MIQAYILVQTDAGTAPQVASAAATISGVSRADEVTGPYDVILTVSAADVESLGKQVICGVQSIPGVTRTITCPAVSS